MTEAQEERIRAHGEALIECFPALTGQNPMSVCRKLRRLEVALSRMNERDCSEPMTETERDSFDAEYERTCDKVKALLWGEAATCWADAPEGTARIRFNGDPRGYALKIHDGWMVANRDRSARIARDWGGYGLIAPEIDASGEVL
jgi:hypothetical protein